LSPDLPQTSPWSETQEACMDESMSGLGVEAKTRIAAVVTLFHIHKVLGYQDKFGYETQPCAFLTPSLQVAFIQGGVERWRGNASKPQEGLFLLADSNMYATTQNSSFQRFEKSYLRGNGYCCGYKVFCHDSTLMRLRQPLSSYIRA